MSQSPTTHPMPQQNPNAHIMKGEGSAAFQNKLKIKSIVDTVNEASDDQKVRIVHIQAANNPLLEAAKPLLFTLAQIPQDLHGTVKIESFRQLLEHELITFQKICQKANIKREHVITASYCLCTALDEAANSTAWGGSQHAGHIGVWSSKLLASTLHGDVDGGIKFFLLISKLIKNPDEHLHLLETLYHILCLGFEGQYATAPNGQQRLESIRQRVLTVLTSVRAPLPREISPNWQPLDHIKISRFGRIPVWITASVFGLCTFALFSWYQYQLLAAKKTIVADITAIENNVSHPTNFTPEVIAAAPVKTPAITPTVTPENIPESALNRLLASETRKGFLTISEENGLTHITLRSDISFEPESSALSERILTTLQKIAHYLSQTTDKVRVVVHTDNNTPAYSAQRFTKERANSVAYALSSQGVTKNRIETIGRGMREPLVPNTSAVNRSINRRVDILVTSTNIQDTEDLEDDFLAFDDFTEE